MDFAKRLPWYAKLGTKLLLARLPFDYRIWRQIGIFKHGSMERPEYSLGVFRTHCDRVTFARKGQRFVAMELGPGDSLVSALICFVFGAARSYLIDTGPYARADIGLYRKMADYLYAHGFNTPDLNDVNTLDQLLARCSATYAVNGLASLRALPAAEVDFVWSQAVLEHVRLSEFDATMHELRRVLRSDGVCSHRIDLRDHLDGGLNNLRFPNRLWESDFFAQSGFYTNRIRYSRMLESFRSAGFAVEVFRLERWDRLPIRRDRLAREFRSLSDEELCISAFDVVLRPR